MQPFKTFKIVYDSEKENRPAEIEYFSLEIHYYCVSLKKTYQCFLSINVDDKCDDFVGC